MAHEANIGKKNTQVRKNIRARRRRSVPRQHSLVYFDFERLPSEYRKKYPFRAGRTYVFFGEIPNMTGHCIVADHLTGRIYSGFHTENFIEVPADDV